LDANNAKRPYEAPKLLEYGELQKLTRNGNGAGTDGNPNPGNTKNCWIAEVLYGVDSPRTHLLRAWLNTVYGRTVFGRIIVGAYSQFGKQVAAVARHSAALRRVLRPLFNGGLRRAQRHYMSVAA
jgi:hypothetical protein